MKNGCDVRFDGDVAVVTASFGIDENTAHVGFTFTRRSHPGSAELKKLELTATTGQAATTTRPMSGALLLIPVTQALYMYRKMTGSVMTRGGRVRRPASSWLGGRQ